MNLINRITTASLVLRPLEAADAAELQQLLARNRDYMLPWVPWAGKEPEPVEEKKRQIREWKGAFYLDQKYIYGVFDTAEAALIGLVFLFTRQGRGTLEIGYIIDQQEAGKGYATEAGYALTKLGFEHLKTEKMVIICSPLNAASARVPEKLGYKLESTRLSVDRDEQGKREELMVWRQYIEEYQPLVRFEPLVLLQEPGW